MMNRFYKLLFTLTVALGALWSACPAYAQLNVQLEPIRSDYILGEDVMLKITITNHTDSSIALMNTPGRSWLHFDVIRKGDFSGVAPVNVPRFPNLTITPGSRRSYNVSLKPHFNFTKEGAYRVTATLRLPDMRTTYSSNAAMFNLGSGGTVKTFTVQARGERLKMSLKSLTWKRRTLFFGQVVNADTNLVVGACFMGEFLSFMPPKALLDRAQNLHMLCQTTPTTFTYAVMDTFGNCKERKLLRRGNGIVDLVSTGGGIRYTGLVPIEKPKNVKDTYHSATERP